MVAQADPVLLVSSRSTIFHCVGPFQACKKVNPKQVLNASKMSQFCGFMPRKNLGARGVKKGNTSKACLHL